MKPDHHKGTKAQRPEDQPVVKVFVRVNEIPSSNRSWEEQVAGAWKGSGALRISVAHRRRNCGFLSGRGHSPEHSQIVELPAELLEHEIFAELATCLHCWREGR